MTMVERVARALEAKIGGSEFTSYGDAARAVIEAMREPSEQMLFAADWLENGTRGAWQAMIDAALSEEQGR